MAKVAQGGLIRKGQERMAKNAKTKTRTKANRARPTRETWDLRLYVAGQTPKSVAAFGNLKKICEEHLAGSTTSR